MQQVEPLTNAELRAAYELRGTPAWDAARDRLVCSIMPFVFSYAAKYFATTPHLVDDIISVGAVAACDAVDAFNPNTGHVLITYAAPVITRRCVELLRSEFGARTTNDELVLDRLVSDADTPADVFRKDAHQAVWKHLRELPRDQAYAVAKSYGIGTAPASRADIAADLKVSTETVRKRVRMAESNLARRLREYAPA